MKSVMTHSFARVPKAEIQRSVFDRTHGYKTTFDAGYLIPVLCDEALPGDTFTVNMAAFARLATPIKPVMDNMFMDSFFFFVPLRLIWDNWERFNGAQDDPGDSTDFLCPQVLMTGGGAAIGSLSDYFGIPTGIGDLPVNAFWHRAYNLVYNTWFRDQNLENSAVVDKDNGPDTLGDYFLRRRGKRHDYFTSCLPWPQKGPDVFLPLGNSAPVLTNENNIKWSSIGGGFANELIQVDSGNQNLKTDGVVTGDGLVKFGSESGLYADLGSATASTINAIREAFQVQRMYERDARGGTRYTEILKAHFGVTSPDSRLQRPEYLGGGSSPVNIHPVAQTAASPDDPTNLDAQGNLAAFGTASFNGHGFSKSFTEHGVILGIVSVRADLTYQQGLNRMFSRRNRFDFFWPALAHLGEQTVLNKEIFADLPPGDALDEQDGVFGYQERFAEYRYKPSLITGQFRSDHPATLDIWHLAQFFEDQPTLSDDFIREDPPIDRIIAVPTEPHFLFDAFFKMKCARPMPVFGVPGLVDHF